MEIKSLKLQHISRRLELLKQFLEQNTYSRPNTGWIRTIRQCYSMSIQQLAKRVGVSYSRIATAEKAEVTGHITLASLQKIANALDCDVFYTLVPRSTNLKTYLYEQARKKAKIDLTRLSQTMKLEDQDLDDAALKSHFEDFIKAYLENPKRLWNE